MGAGRWAAASWIACAMVVAGVVSGPVPVPRPVAFAWTSPMTDGNTVKYYVVRSSWLGEPEHLWEIAQRFLGDGARFGVIFDLNSGRVQADGGRLADPSVLNPGWILVLPANAEGDGIQTGVLTAGGQQSGAPTGSSSRGAEPCLGPDRPAAGLIPWAQLRLAPSRAWITTRGGGLTVALLDSGVDPATPRLGHHVSTGADFSRSAQRCDGHGTAVAAVIAGQPSADDSFVGLAPDAVVNSIRVRQPDGSARPADVAAGILAASTARSSVIALTADVDLFDPAVRGAMFMAGQRGAVLVTAAPVSPDAGSPAERRVGLPVGTIAVGGVDAAGVLIAAYRRGMVDVVAPGARITTLRAGRGSLVAGTGTEYAVAFVAALAVLIRASRPDLPPADVVKQIEMTADHPRADPQNARYGWGLVNPGAAVGGAVDAAPAADDGERLPGQTESASAIVLLGVGGLAILYIGWSLARGRREAWKPRSSRAARSARRP